MFTRNVHRRTDGPTNRPTSVTPQPVSRCAMIIKLFPWISVELHGRLDGNQWKCTENGDFPRKSADHNFFHQNFPWNSMEMEKTVTIFHGNFSYWHGKLYLVKFWDGKRHGKCLRNILAWKITYKWGLRFFLQYWSFRFFINWLSPQTVLFSLKFQHKFFYYFSMGNMGIKIIVLLWISKITHIN